MNDSGYSAGFASHPESHRGSRGWYEGGFTPGMGRGRGKVFPGYDGSGFGFQGSHGYQGGPGFERGFGHNAFTPNKNKKHRGGGVMTGSGTANEVLAQIVKDLQEENKILLEKIKKEKTKEKTVEEINNLKIKNTQLKGKVEGLKKEVADRDAKLSEVALLDNVIENFKRVKECESFSLEEILEKSSNRVKKHLKIIIENKLEKEDLQSSLKIILHRLDGDSIWGEIINMISKLDNKELVEKIITELGGGIEKPVHSMSESDSAPSSSETEDNGDSKLEPKRLDFQKVVDDDPKKQTATKLDRVAKKKIKDKKVKAIETRQSKLKEALEDQAAIIMETGDDTLFNCYDDIIEQQQNIIKTLTDAPTNASVEEGETSPIIRKNKPTEGAPNKNFFANSFAKPQRPQLV